MNTRLSVCVSLCVCVCVGLGCVLVDWRFSDAQVGNPAAAEISTVKMDLTVSPGGLQTG